MYTILIDNREQLPYTFSTDNFITLETKLPTGDYSIQGYEKEFTVERKSVDDFVKTISTDHTRWVAELKRLQTFDFSAVLIEGSCPEITEQKYSSQISYERVFGNVVSILVEWHIPVIFAHDRQHAIYILERLILKFLEAKQRLSNGKSATKSGAGGKSKTSRSKRQSEQDIL